MVDKDLKKEIELSLARAAECWEQTGSYFVVENSTRKTLSKAANDSSKVPGFPGIEWSDYQKGCFICLIADLRNSSMRFGSIISGWHEPEKRVLFETFAMLAMFDFAISKYGGVVTEYLGDGCLGLFYVPDDLDEQESGKVFKNALKAAKYIVGEGRNVLNKCLQELTYPVPALDIGVGVAYSKGIVTRVGSAQNNSVKVIGSCVYKAAKLSDGVNEFILDKSFTTWYPSSKGGKLSFMPMKNSRVSIKNKDFIIPMTLEE